MFPHERSLVTKYEHKPFVLLGVNVDPQIEDLQDAQRKHSLNWRSWWDGMGGPIAAEWKVQSLPSLFLLDHKGNVRWKETGAPDFQTVEALIDKLIRDAEADKTTAVSKR